MPWELNEAAFRAPAQAAALVRAIRAHTDPARPLQPGRLAALLACGALLAPGKLVYLPLAALVLAVPAVRLGRHAKVLKLGYLAACLALALALNTGLLAGLGAQDPAAVQTDAAQTAAVQADDAARGAKTRPAAPDEAYEALICGENTLENYVRRLYYYAEDTRDPAQSEVEFWVQALAEGDVSPVTLGQTFFFNTQRLNSYAGGMDILSRASLALLGQDLTATNPDLAAYYDEGGPALVYKIVYALEPFADAMAALGLEPGVMDDRLPLDRATLAAEVQAAQATRATQSVTDEADRATYTPGYILQHLPGTALLLVRSAVQNGDHYLRTLVGGSLSYYTLDLAWGWVAALYLLLAFAALPARDAAPAPAGALRAGCALAAVLCCLLAVAGCLLWTPVQYETLYGLQGRYFLPVLPLLLLTCWPRRLAALALVQFGVLMNAMLAVIAR